MNLRKWSIGVCLLMALASCGKDLSNDLSTSSEVTDKENESSVQEPMTKEVTINLMAGKEVDDDLRVVYGVDTSDEMGRLLGLEMPEQDVILRVAVRRGDGQPIVQDIRFKKTLGRNHASYSGKITVPIDGDGQYKIAAILKQIVGSSDHSILESNINTPTVLTKNKMRMFASPPVLKSNLTDQIDLEVPYVTSWQDLTIQGDAAQPVKLILEPQGTVLRMRIRNNATTVKTFHYLRFVTNAFVHAISYNMLESRDNYPAWYRESESQEIGMKLPGSGITVQPNQYSEWVYVWVMPYQLVNSRDRYTVASLGINAGVYGDYTQAFSTNQPLPLGSVPMTLVYGEGGHEATFEELEEVGEEWGQATSIPKLPLEYISEGALHMNKSGFVSGVRGDNPDVGMFSFTDISAMTQLQIAGATWHAPTSNELAGIFIPEMDRSGYGTSKLSRQALNVLEPSIKIGSVTQSYYADYKSINGDMPLYGVRFKSKSNRYRTAFRYSLIGQVGDVDRRVVVECVYLGNTQVHLSDVAREQFWDDMRVQGKVVKREFVAYGYMLNDTKVQQGAEPSVRLGTSTPHDEHGTFYGVYLHLTAIGPRISLYPRESRVPVYLMRSF